MTDPVLRNLHITQRYHELASDLRDAGVGEDATWCAFAVWASKTAGATIRGEVLPARVKQLLVEQRGHPRRPTPLQSRGRSLGRRASGARPPGPRRRRGDGRCRQIDRRRERPCLLGAGPPLYGAARGQPPNPRGHVGGAVGRTGPGRHRRRRDRRGPGLLRLRAGPWPARRASRSGAPGQHAGRVARTAAPAASDQLGLGRGNLRHPQESDRQRRGRACPDAGGTTRPRRTDRSDLRGARRRLGHRAHRVDHATGHGERDARPPA